MGLVYFFSLLILGYFAGTWFDKKHIESILAREAKFSEQPAVTFEDMPADIQPYRCELAMGSVVVSADYFQKVSGGVSVPIWR